MPGLFAVALLLRLLEEQASAERGCRQWTAAAERSEADCAAARARRNGSHEVWSAAWGGARVGQEYRVQPPVGCHSTDPLCDCAADYCLSPADCIAKPGGICKGVTAAECIYPGSDEGKSCEQDSVHPPVRRRLPPQAGWRDLLCDRSGKCETNPHLLLHLFFPYVSDCHSDAECTAAPGGSCQLSLGTEWEV